MPFVIHHVGARFGNTPFPIPERFAREIHQVLYDADTDCIDGLSDQPDSDISQTQLVAACLSDRDGAGELKITVNPSASSLLEPSAATAGYVQPLFGIDWSVSDCAAIVERRPLATSRLDTLLSGRPDLPPPDFLSLDTQGSEYEIIAGGRETISRHVVGIIVEVEFVELYERVNRFGAIAEILEELGFHFAGFQHMIDAQTARQPIGLRSAGFPIAADALFLRRLDSVANMPPEGVAKLAFCSLVFGFMDHAVAALEKTDYNFSNPSDEGWQNMLAALGAAISLQPRIFLPRFPDILPPDQRKRFSSEADISKWPSIMDIAAWRKAQEERNGPISEALTRHQDTNDSAVERILRENGFVELADKVNFCRRDQAYKVEQFLKAADNATGQEKSSDVPGQNAKSFNEPGLPINDSLPTGDLKNDMIGSGFVGSLDGAPQTSPWYNWRPVRPALRPLSELSEELPDLPSILAVSIPKSGTIYINRLFADSFGLSPFVCSNQYFPEDQLHFSAVPELSKGGKCVSVHIDPSPANLQLLDEFVPKWIVHMRDPRSVVLSWTHQIQQLYEERRYRNLLLVAPTPPRQYYEWPFERRLDWNISYFLPTVLAWMNDWLAVADKAPDRILVTEYRQLREAEAAFARQVADFIGLPAQAAWASPPKTIESHYRSGQLEEWRNVFNKHQIELTSAMIPAWMKVRFGWA